MVYTALFPPAAAVVSRHEGRTVVWLAGEHDVSTLGCLTDALSDAIAADEADLVVDLSGVTFMGAATIDALIRARAVLRRQSRNLTLRSPSRCARRVVETCGFFHLIES